MKPSLDAIEEDIRATRSRLGEILARADRDYGLRPGLRGVLRIAKRPPGREIADKPGETRVRLAGLALPAAALAFAIGFLAAQRFRRAGKAPPAPPQL